MTVLGITGCPGSGKSLLARSIAETGWELIDADEIGRGVVEESAGVLSELAAVFGGDILDGDGLLRRRVLAERAFSDDGGIARLNDIVHPRLISRVCGLIDGVKSRGGRCVVDCALIFEWNIGNRFDIVVCVSADIEIRKLRLMERDGRSAREIEGMFAAQLPEEEKVRRSDVTIRNEHTAERLRFFGTILGELARYEEG